MTCRRSFLTQILTSGAAPVFVPAHVLRSQSAPSNKITLGVIGVGAQGTHDMRAFLNHDDVRVTALCDVNTRNIENARRIVAEHHGIADVRVFDDFREMNRDASIDAVLMALPVHWHSIPATDAVLNGKHIYHEKPMGMSFAESKHVRAAVRKMGVVFQFGTQQRSDLKFRRACELARNGRLGRIKEIQVGVPGGRTGPDFPEQPVPAHVNWERWVGPAAMTAFHTDKLRRDNHENITNFSLGMISCWGIHHLDIAQWGNGTDDTGPVSIEGEGTYPDKGGCDAVLGWKMRFEYANAAPVTFVNERNMGINHGIRFIGENGWVHVLRGKIAASDDAILRDPANKEGTMPVKLPVSVDHTRNFVDAIKTKQRSICDIETAVRSDTLPQLAAISLKAKRKLTWDPATEMFTNDESANAFLNARPFRAGWLLPEIG
ncbi:MAG: Gfo/Idh/MocA family oxidoreductase [Verrucomicrobiaceae bacterium]|nr:Gfo/Idh/MocA family oxidoreductase [Verrucomicrobiaceae bacterium]